MVTLKNPMGDIDEISLEAAAFISINLGNTAGIFKNIRDLQRSHHGGFAQSTGVTGTDQ